MLQETPLWDSQDDEEYGEEFEEALLEAAADRYYNVQAQQVTGSSLYLACRIGDLDRVRCVSCSYKLMTGCISGWPPINKCITDHSCLQGTHTMMTVWGMQAAD